MLIQATSLSNNAIRSLEDRNLAGRVRNIIVDPDNGQIIAFVLSQFWGKAKVVSPMDVVGFSPGMLVIRNDEVILPLKEIVRAQKIWKDKIHIINSVCKTESGKVLGTIDDFLIDLDNMLVVKYYISGNNILAPLSPSRIILANKTVKITKGLVIVQDEEEQMSQKEMAKVVNT
ncbi:MAG: hypothetical protein ABH837_03495 [bacterium]